MPQRHYIFQAGMLAVTVVTIQHVQIVDVDTHYSISNQLPPNSDLKMSFKKDEESSGGMCE